MLPIWFIVAAPIMWLIVLPVNFIIDSVVLWLASKVFSVGDFKSFYKKTILKVWLVGFAAQLIGSLFLFMSQGYFGEWWYEYITTPVALNPLDNLYSLLFTLLGVCVSGGAAYFFNRKFSFKNLPLTDKVLRSVGLTLALMTLPMMYFLPSRAIYDPETPVVNFTNHIVWSVQSLCEVTPVEPVAADAVTLRTEDGFTYGHLFSEALNFAKTASATIERAPEFTVSFRSPDYEIARDVTAELWFMDTGLALFRVDGTFYLADKYQSARLLTVLDGTYVPPVYDEETGLPEAAPAPQTTTA
ncbi:MAG: hypothetical protein VB111_05885 [Clostridiaceae bacterium]|nr:hypothetical protein [Clostridiaceae bacterium]